MHVDAAFAGSPDTANQPEQRRFSSSVPSDDTDHPTLWHGEGHIPQCPKAVRRITSEACQDSFLQGVEPFSARPAELLAYASDHDRTVHQISSAKLTLIRRNSKSPRLRCSTTRS